jgi:cytochrome b subunit of formate dehydrogenase
VTYVLSFVLLFTGLWLLSGREGAASPLAVLLGLPDTSIHTYVGWLLVALALIVVVGAPRAVFGFFKESFAFRRVDAGWFRSWPGALLSGRFGSHEGHFDPGQRIANIVMIGGLIALSASGAGLAFVHGGPAFVWLLKIHRWSTLVLAPVVAGHVLIAIGVLPGYRGVWRAMHGNGAIDSSVAQRLWPASTDEGSAREG